MASFLVQKAFDSGVTLHVVLGDETSEELCRSFLAKNGPRGWVRKLRVNIEVMSIKTLYSIDNSCTLPRPRLRVGPAVRQMVRGGLLKELKIVMGPDPKGIFDSWPLTLGAFLQNALGFGLMWLSESSLDSLRIWTVSKDRIRVRGLCDHHAAKPGGCGEGSDQDTLQIETEELAVVGIVDGGAVGDGRPMYGLPPRRTGNGTGTQK